MSHLFRCGLEWIGEDYQGWCINFADRTDSGPVNMAFDAAGELWIAQVGRGWSSKGQARTGLQTLRLGRSVLYPSRSIRSVSRPKASVLPSPARSSSGRTSPRPCRSLHPGPTTTGANTVQIRVEKTAACGTENTASRRTGRLSRSRRRWWRGRSSRSPSRTASGGRQPAGQSLRFLHGQQAAAAQDPQPPRNP